MNGAIVKRKLSREAVEMLRKASLLPPLNVRGFACDQTNETPILSQYVGLSSAGKCYFAEAAALGLVKIGAARDPKQRVRKLRTGCPVALELVAVLDGGFRTEAEMQNKFSHLRERGEWFRVDDEMRAFIAQQAGPA